MVQRNRVRLGRRAGADIVQAGVDGRDARQRWYTHKSAVGLVVRGVEGVSTGEGRLQVGLRCSVIGRLGHRQEGWDRDREQNSDNKQDNEQLDKREALLSRLLETEAPRAEPLDVSLETFLLGSMETATKVNIGGSRGNFSRI